MNDARDPRDMEALASLEHRFWCGWAHYMLGLLAKELGEAEAANPGASPSTLLGDLPCVQRWQRRILLDYAWLGETEQEVDRRVVREKLGLYRRVVDPMHEAFLLHLVDVVWHAATDGNSVPSADWARRLIGRAMDRTLPRASAQSMTAEQLADYEDQADQAHAMDRDAMHALVAEVRRLRAENKKLADRVGGC